MKYLILLLFFCSIGANAQDIYQTQTQNGSGSGAKTSKSMPTKQKAPTNKQRQKQQQQQAQTTQVGVEASAASSAINEGNSLSTNTHVEASAPDIVMIPSNNTSNCMKVYGLSFSNTNGGGGLGWPYRDKSCDFEQAADDAAATGQHTIAWYWRCHKKNLYKQFNDSAKHKDQQIEACHNRMMQMFVKQKPPVVITEEPEPLVTVNCEVGQHPKTHEKIFKACQEK